MKWGRMECYVPSQEFPSDKGQTDRHLLSVMVAEISSSETCIERYNAVFNYFG